MNFRCHLTVAADKCLNAAGTLPARLEAASEVKLDMVQFLEVTCTDYAAAVDRVHAAVDCTSRARMYEARTARKTVTKEMEAEITKLQVSAGQLQACTAMCESALVTHGVDMALYADRLLTQFTAHLDNWKTFAPCLVFEDDVDFLARVSISKIKTVQSVNGAMISCAKFKGAEFRLVQPCEMTALNEAVEGMLAVSMELALEYCKSVYYISMYGLRNSSVAGSVEPSTVALVLKAVRTWPYEAAVLAKAFRALAHLCSHNPVNISTFLSNDGLQDVFSASDTHFQIPAVQCELCWLLYFIAHFSATGQRTLVVDNRAAGFATRVKLAYDGKYFSAVADWLLKELVIRVVINEE